MGHTPLEEAQEWFAMRATYRRELAAQRLLDGAGIESYIPMERKVRVRGRRAEEVPAVHNLVFVHTSRSVLQRFKKEVPYLQYMIDRSDPERPRPIVVPDKAMSDFIRVVQAAGAEVEYEAVGSRSYPAGARVRIVGGELDGVEGILSRTGKSRDKKLVVTLNGVLSVAARVSPSSVVLLPDE